MMISHNDVSKPNNNVLTVDLLWDELRDVACSTKRQAKTIVLLKKQDLQKAISNINKNLIEPIK